jgi:hypothetical protein
MSAAAARFLETQERKRRKRAAARAAMLGEVGQRARARSIAVRSAFWAQARERGLVGWRWIRRELGRL